MYETALAAFPPGIFLFRVSYKISAGQLDHRYVLANNIRDVEKYFESHFDLSLVTLVKIEQLTDLVYFPANWEIPNKIPVTNIQT